jgi:hypothetical protein
MTTYTLRSISCVSVAALALLAGCGGTAAPDARANTAAGVLQLLSAQPGAQSATTDTSKIIWSLAPNGATTPIDVIVAPETVQVNQDFKVVVTTIGLDGCWSAAGVTTAYSGNVATLTPEDVHSGSAVCTMILGFLPHGASVRFPATGQATIRVAGRRMRRGDTTWSEPVTAERRLIVR